MTRLLDRASPFFPAGLAAALPVFFLPTASDSFILPRASLVVGGACLGVALALVSRRRLDLGPLRWPLVAALAAAMLAFTFSVSWPLSFAGSYTRYESLPMRWSYLGLFVSAAWLLRDRLPRELVVAGFVFGTGVACLEGVQQWAAHVPFRPDGNLGNANLLAALVAMALPLAFRRALRLDAFLVAWTFAIVLLSAGWWVTTSRSGALGMVAGGMTLVVFAARGRHLAGAVVLALGAAAAGLVAILASPLRHLNDDPPELRLHLWSDAMRMIAARPLTGWGHDATGLSFGRFLSQDYASLVTFDRVHSGPLDLAAMQGVFGVAALGSVLAIVFSRAWRNRANDEVAALAAALVGYTVWVLFNFDWAPATGPFWLLAGTLWAATSNFSASVDKLEAPAVGHTGNVARPAAALTLVVAASVLAALPVLADFWFVKGRADLSVKVDPLQPQYHWALGTIEELRLAAALGETEPAMYVRLGDLERSRGNVARARADYLRALEIDPYYRPASESLTTLGA